MAQVFISLGSNVEKELYVQRGLDDLEQSFGPLLLSSLFESEAIGFEGDIFFNMVVGFITEQSIDQVTDELRAIEIKNGRSPTAKKFSPRTLDLDLLLFDDLICQSPAIVPREEICHNAFVLWPLSEVAGERIHPTEKVSIQSLWRAFDQTSQQLKPVPLDWHSKL